MKVLRKPLVLSMQAVLLGLAVVPVMDANAVIAPNGYVYYPIAPCRILETRTIFGGPGPYPKATSITLNGTGSSFTSQNGNASCDPIPADAVSIQASIGMLNTQNQGDILVWRVGDAQPNSSFGVFNPSAANVPPNPLLPGEVLFNGASGIIPLGAGGQFNVKLQNSPADLTI